MSIPGTGSLQPLLALLRLASPSLPVGAFSYSRGLEAAVDAGRVDDEESAATWILGVLEHAVCPLDGAALSRLHDAFAAGDLASAAAWAARLRAFRESAELLLEDEQMSLALARQLYTKEDAEFLVRAGALPPERIVGVETGGCPHTAIREDASINLTAVDGLVERSPVSSWSSSRAAAKTSPPPSAPSCRI